MRITALLLLVLAGHPVAAQTAADTLPLADERMMEFAAAWSTDDEAAVRNLMADDVVLLGREPLVGVENVMGWAREQMAGNGTLVLDPLHSERHGDTAFQVGRWEMGASSGVHTVLWQQHEGGTWRIASMHILNATTE
jgi:ketosteroid isomerase-like protein